MRSLRFGIRLSLMLGLSACTASRQQVGDIGAQTTLAVVTDAPTQHPPPPRCLQASYRLPIVTQVTVPDAIVGGVLIPQHPAYVVLQPGVWQVVETDGVRHSGTPTVPPACPLQPGAR